MRREVQRRSRHLIERPALRVGERDVQRVAAPDDVASIGYAVGYDSPSQFSREYRRMFGAPPGQDATRLQTVATVQE